MGKYEKVGIEFVCECQREYRFVRFPYAHRKVLAFSWNFAVVISKQLPNKHVVKVSDVRFGQVGIVLYANITSGLVCGSRYPARCLPKVSVGEPVADSFIPVVHQSVTGQVI